MSPPHLRRAYHPPSPCSIVASGALRWILTEGAIDEPRAAIEIRPAPGAAKCRREDLCLICRASPDDTSEPSAI